MRTRSFRCPVCGEWIIVPRETVDYVHKCIKADKTRMTTQTDFRKIPNRVNLRIDENGWHLKGWNVAMPKKRKKHSDVIDNLYDEQEVETYIDLT